MVGIKVQTVWELSRTNQQTTLTLTTQGTCVKIARASSSAAGGPLLQVPDDSLYIRFSSYYIYFCAISTLV